jgi:hypothetical protein
MLSNIVLGYVMFSLLCGGVLVMMAIGDRVYSRNGEQHPQKSDKLSPELSTEIKDNVSSTVSVEHEEHQRCG